MDKKERGITLIVLVITITILLILVSVTVSLITEDENIIKEAENATEESEKIGIEQHIDQTIFKVEQEKRNPNIDNVIDALVSEGIIEEDKREETKNTGIITIKTSSGTEYEILDKLNDYINTVDIVSSDVIEAGQKAIGGNKRYREPNGIETEKKIIPEGFVVSNIPGEMTISEGLVVIAPDGSEFVWVPVPDYEHKFKRTNDYYAWNMRKLANQGEAGDEGKDKGNWDNPQRPETEQTKDEARKMYTSVYNNGGFYIARYEAGKEGEYGIVSKKNVVPYMDLKWNKTANDNKEGALELARKMATKNDYKNVTSTLCYGVQWDAALNFIDPNYITNEIASGEPNCGLESYVRKSVGRGWYDENAGENPESRTGIDKPEVKNKEKNIYDMAGNVEEWTMETLNSTDRIMRGGAKNKTSNWFSASTKDVAGLGPVYTAGFRVTLFIN